MLDNSILEDESGLETSETNYNDPVIRGHIADEQILQLHIPLIVGL